MQNLILFKLNKKNALLAANMASTPQVQSSSVSDDLRFDLLLSLNVYKGCAENIKMDPESQKIVTKRMHFIKY